MPAYRGVVAPRDNGPVTERLDRQGLVYAFLAYGFWGVFPIFMDELRPAGALEIVAHRALWSLVFCAILVLALRRWRRLREVLRDTRTALTLALAALLLAVNWGIFIYAVFTERVADTSLGYYINPLITVALGVAVLHERLHPAQTVAIGLGVVAVAVLGVEHGGVPWIAPALALSFAAYALLKKRLGATVDALTGFTVETLALLPVAVDHPGGGLGAGRHDVGSGGSWARPVAREHGRVDGGRPHRLRGGLRATASLRRGPHPVPHAHHDVHPRGHLLPRGHVRRAVARVRPGVGRARRHHGRCVAAREGQRGGPRRASSSPSPSSGDRAPRLRARRCPSTGTAPL